MPKKEEKKMEKMLNKELVKEMYKEVLEAHNGKYWYNESEYLKHYENTIKINGYYLNIDRLEIKKDFCYADDYDTPEDPISHNMCEKARNDKNYFKEKNMEKINKIIKKVKDSTCLLLIDKDDKVKKCYICYVKKYGDDYYDNWNKLLNVDEILCEIKDEVKDKILCMLNEIRNNFEKRVDTYLKKYGLSKVHAWSYWSMA